MQSGLLRFQTIPQIGFAHHFYTEEDYRVHYGEDRSVEIVHVKSGDINGELYGKSFQVHAGEFLILFRHLPITLWSDGSTLQSHCSIQLIMDYAFSMIDKTTDIPEDADAMILPFVTPLCAETEAIKKELFAVVSDLGAGSEGGFSAGLAGAGILLKLGRIYEKKLRGGQSAPSLLEYRIRKYIAEHIGRKISLEELSERLHRTPNYLNHVFREKNGVSIHQYMNRERVRMIAELMQAKKLSFRTACENAGISDISYGYRLFKKHMGITPGEYLAGRQYLHRL